MKKKKQKQKKVMKPEPRVGKRKVAKTRVKPQSDVDRLCEILLHGFQIVAGALDDLVAVIEHGNTVSDDDVPNVAVREKVREIEEGVSDSEADSDAEEVND